MVEATLFTGGRVYTGRRYAEALLVENGRVVGVGAEAAVRRDAPTGVERRELAGGLVVPGLADAHLHLGELARVRNAFDASRARSIPELEAQLRTWGEAHAGRPIVGHGLDIERLAERRWPTLLEVDRAVRDRPLVLFHASGHAAVVNSETIERVRARVGNAAGTLGRPAALFEQELATVRPIVEEAQPLTAAGLQAVIAEIARLGITAVGSMNSGPDEVAALEALDKRRELTIVVRAFPALTGRLGEGPSSPDGSQDHFRIAGGKAFLDGAFGPRTAALAEPYADDRGTRGVELGDDAALVSVIALARDRGLLPALHAIGDRAVARAARLLAFEAGEGPIGRVEHASLTPPAVLPRLQALRPTLVVQPPFLLSDVWLETRLGAPRARWAYAFRTLVDLGIPLAGSSDAPFDGLDPWRGMRAAVERRDELGRSANPWRDQGLTEEEALALYTGWAHRALGEPDRGTLEPGARADLVVLGVSRTGDAMRTGGTAVRQTWADGRPIGPTVPA